MSKGSGVENKYWAKYQVAGILLMQMHNIKIKNPQ